MKRCLTKCAGAQALIAACVICLVPGSAGASTGVTAPKGTLIPVGSIVYGTSTNAVIKNSGVGTIGCNQVTLRLEMVKNSAAAGVEAKSGSQTSTASTCFQNGTTAITVDNIKIEFVRSLASEPGKGTKTSSYIAHVGGLNCKFQLNNITGTYTSETSEITYTNQPQTVTPAACGAGGTFSGTFKLETQAGASSPLFVM